MAAPTKKARFEELQRILFENQPISGKPVGSALVPLNSLADLFRRSNASENEPYRGRSSLEMMNASSNKLFSRFPAREWFNASGDVACTLRVECRRDGADAEEEPDSDQGIPTEGQERILLFRSDQRGSIGKIVYSYYCEDGWGNGSNPSLHAKVQVVEVKDAYRGFDLGGLLVSLAAARLARILSAGVSPRQAEAVKGQCSPHAEGDTQTRRITIHLDAEEDSRRHNRLVSFYRHLGFDVRADAKVSYLNNNDGETIRKVVMQRVLSSSVVGDQESLLLLLNGSAAFLPISFSCIANDRRVDVVPRFIRRGPSFARCHDDWLIVSMSDQEGMIWFVSTTGNELVLPDMIRRSGNGCSRTEPTRFLLLRAVTDVDTDAPFTELLIYQTQSSRYLACDPYRRCLILTTRPIMWSCDASNLRLCCLSDVTQGLRDHYRRSWKRQTVSFVQQMRERYLSFSVRGVTLLDALILAEQVRADPFTQMISTENAPSLRALCLHTAETADHLGFPDWVVLLALVYHLGSLVPVLDVETGSSRCTEAFDWTPAIESRVVGYAPPTSAKYCEFHDADDEDQEMEECCCGTSGVYDQSCGLDRVLLTFTGPEYMYNWLRHNHAHVPEEGVRMIRYASLVDWHSHGAYGGIVNAEDAEILPLVVDFHEVIQRAWWETVTLETDETRKWDDFEFLWSGRYADLASKYGLDGILRW